MTQTEYIAALRAKLAEVASSMEDQGYDRWLDEIEALIAIEPEREATPPVVTHRLALGACWLWSR